MNSMHILIWPLCTGLLISFLFEQLLTPRPSLPWQRSCATVFIHIGTWLALLGIVLLLLRRPWFAVTILWSFQLLLVLVNHAKYDSLREAFFFRILNISPMPSSIQDFIYLFSALPGPFSQQSGLLSLLPWDLAWKLR